jgi:hypothetical protein
MEPHGPVLRVRTAPVDGRSWTRPACVYSAVVRFLLLGNTPSKVIGTVAHGRLENGHVIPPWGPGFMTYSFLGSALGRQYVDGRVRDALVATFAARSRAERGRRFVVGETGWPRGGRFRPHRSHQNGMAVDVFMPVEIKKGPGGGGGAAPPPPPPPRPPPPPPPPPAAHPHAVQDAAQRGQELGHQVATRQ